MPIVEPAPWRHQYFDPVPCPPHLYIPTDDPEAWEWNPAHRWVFDKLQVALSQGLAAGPHGTMPPRFPVFSKPIMNFRGLGAGSRILNSAEDYEAHHTAGHFWMTLLDGAHVSSDVALVAGEPKWWRHATGLATGEGMFDRWTIHAAADPPLEAACGAWIAKSLRGFTGILNLETIGGRIIEAHLRLSDQWPDLYGIGWTEAFVALYRDRVWRFADSDRRDGFSIVLCGAWGKRYRHPPPELIRKVAGMPGVSSVQITFHEDKAPERHSMPPGGFRVAIVNAFDLAQGEATREVLREAILGEAPAVNVARRQQRMPAMPTSRSPSPRRRTFLVAAAAAVGLLAPAVWSEELSNDLAGKLTPEQRKIYLDYSKAKGQHDKRHNAYWTRVEAKREARRAKRLLGQAYDADDYVAQQPPKYAGPELPAEIAKIVFEVKPPVPAPPLPTVADFLAQAKALYGFVPTPTSEQDFKRRYAQEALAVGLSKDQVVRIYALETGGQGTYDMQAGFNPLTKQGRAISSALGYAQLLHANSTSELVKHGEAFARRLLALAAAAGTSRERAEALRAKAAIVRHMLREARSVPNEWSAHVKFAGTPPGLGIHTLNLDADVGPWLQVLKLKALKDEAARAGRTSLAGSEIELMNLAGPRTGLEMMTPVGQNMPTANFFSEGGYYRNTIVREKTAAELLAALNDRMEVNVKKPGAVEFAQIFDEVARR